MKYPYIGKSEQGNHYLVFSKCKIFSMLSKSWLYERGGFGDFENVTAEYLRNTKIKIESQGHSEMVQMLVFNAGGGWVNSGRTIAEDVKEIYISGNLSMRAATIGDVRFFNQYQGKEITLPLPPKEDKEMEKPIYTKEMHERGELPPVGSEVIVVSLLAMVLDATLIYLMVWNTRLHLRILLLSRYQRQRMSLQLR